MNRSGVYLIDGGNGKYYLCGDESEKVSEILETNLDNIIFTLKSGSSNSLGSKMLGYVKYDPWEDDKEFVMREFAERGIPFSETHWEIRQRDE